MKQITMKTITMILFIFLCTAVQWAQDDSLTETNKAGEPPSNKVLIIKGESYLENAVAKIVKDSLALRHIEVETVNLKKESSHKYGKYLAIIVFGAIKKNQTIDPMVHTFLYARGMLNETVLVFSVYGQLWPDSSMQQTSEDAITAATPTLDPSKIAPAVVGQVLNILKLDKRKTTSNSSGSY